KRKAIALFALIGTLIWQTAFTQVGVILIAALFGFLLYKQHEKDEEVSSRFPIAKRVSAICLLLFFGLIICFLFISVMAGTYWFFIRNTKKMKKLVRGFQLLKEFQQYVYFYFSVC